LLVSTIPSESNYSLESFQNFRRHVSYQWFLVVKTIWDLEKSKDVSIEKLVETTLS
jgi:hypothetical protein